LGNTPLPVLPQKREGDISLDIAYGKIRGGKKGRKKKDQENIEKVKYRDKNKG
jgi:hypothetical protein